MNIWCPMGPQQATIASTVGAVNSWITLLFAGVLTAFACLGFYKTKKIIKYLMITALIGFGAYFLIYDLVAIWVPVYSWFFYVTDIWMITIIIMGVVILKTYSKTWFV